MVQIKIPALNYMGLMTPVGLCRRLERVRQGWSPYNAAARSYPLFQWYMLYSWPVIHSFRLAPMATTVTSEQAYTHQESAGVAVSPSSDTPCSAPTHPVPIFPR